MGEESWTRGGVGREDWGGEGRGGEVKGGVASLGLPSNKLPPLSSVLQLCRAQGGLG